MEYLDVFTKIERIERTRDLEVDELIACASEGVFVEDEHGQVYPVVAVAFNKTHTQIFYVFEYITPADLEDEKYDNDDTLCAMACRARGYMFAIPQSGLGEVDMPAVYRAGFEINEDPDFIREFVDVFMPSGFTRVKGPSIEELTPERCRDELN